MKNLLFVLILFSFTCCQYKPNKEAVVLVKKANELSLKSGFKNQVELDSALNLVNRAIKIDNKYFSAYNTKSTILFAKKNIDELLLNNLKIIELRPKQPLWLIQRGLFLDIKGDNVEAQKSYTLGINKYTELFEENSNKQDFNLRIEYISAFEAIGNLNMAKIEIKKLQNDFPKNDIVQYYIKEYKLKTKSELINEYYK